MWVWVSIAPAGGLNPGVFGWGSGPGITGIDFAAVAGASAAAAERPAKLAAAPKPATAARKRRRSIVSVLNSIRPDFLTSPGANGFRGLGGWSHLLRIERCPAPRGVDIGRLQRGDRGRNQLLDGLRHVGAISLPAGQPADPFRADQGVVQRTQQELTPPDDGGARQMRQALL